MLGLISIAKCVKNKNIYTNFIHAKYQNKHILIFQNNNSILSNVTQKIIVLTADHAD